MSFRSLIKNGHRASKMAQWVKTHASKPEDPSLIPGTDTVGGRNQLLLFVP
ncbi:hypothetical protein I79_012291 [Cricetulus griseus]|uniref:Uncharacterized protein n=1 Tax=Cricetulus griseus TaxID=10029 RepID=G3HNF3_CRIGR|nr:hypothetical protein I79_012291 [Cricetulus griseus]